MPALIERIPTMLELTSRQRAALIDKLPDLANLAIGALFFGQFLGDRPFSARVALLGVASWIVLIGLALILGRKEGA
jgi:hypothetical protein